MASGGSIRRSEKSLQEFSEGVSPRIVSPHGKSPEVSSSALVSRYRDWAFTCASRNAARVASVPLRLYATRGTGQGKSRAPARVLSKKEVKSLETTHPWLLDNPMFKQAEDIEEILVHPFNQLMQTINPHRSKFETFEETQIFLDITGDSYWLLDFNNIGVPTELYLLPSQFVKVVPSKTDFIAGYLYGRGIKKQAFSTQQIVHFKTPNPRDQFYGMGCLEACISSFDLNDEMNNYERALNRNSGVPSLFVSYDGVTTNDELKRVEADWNRALQGVGKSGKVKVGDNRFKIEKVGFGPREMNFLKGRKWARVEIADAFGVPVALLDTENVNRANADAANYQYQVSAIKPRLKRIENKINEDIIPFYNEDRLFVAFDENVPLDDEFNLERTSTLWNDGLLTKNEARQEQGLQPVADGDEYKNEPSDTSSKELPHEITIRTVREKTPQEIIQEEIIKEHTEQT